MNPLMRLVRSEPSTSLARRIQPKLPVRSLPRVARQRMYAGAQHSRLTADWLAFSTSSDAELRCSLRTLRNRSRQLCRDNDYARHAKRLVRNNIVGRGILFQAQVKKRNGKLAEELNTRIERMFKQWCRKKNCHTGGTLSFKAMQRLAAGDTFEAGEILIRKVRGRRFGDSPVPFALEVIEADQLADDYNGRSPRGNEIRMGVEVDQWQRRVGYWLHKRHPGDFQFTMGTTTELEFVPASEVIHLFIPERVGQTRGVPWLHSTLKRLNNMGGYEEAEIVAARASATVMGFLQSGDPADPTTDGMGGMGAGGMPADGMTGEGPGAQRTYDFEPGVIKELLPGQKFEGWNPTRPNAQMEPFLRYMVRAMGIGGGFSYASISGDYSQSNFSSSRMATNDERDNWRVLQDSFIEDFCQEVYEEWLEMAVMSGALDFADYETNPDKYTEVCWMPRGWDYINPKEDVETAIKAIRAGLESQQGHLAKRGEDYESINRQRRRELDDEAEQKLQYDTNPKVAAQGQPAQAADKKDKPAKGDSDDSAEDAEATTEATEA